MSYLFLDLRFLIEFIKKVIVTTNIYFLRREEFVNFAFLNGMANGPLV